MNKKIVIVIVLLTSIIICLGLKWHMNNVESDRYVLAYVPYKYIQLDSKEIALKKDEEFSFCHNIDSSEIDNNIKLNIENEKIIQQNNGLTIKAIDVGETSIAIETEEGNILKNIKVKVNPIPTDIKINKENLIIEKDKTKKLEVNVLPNNLDNKEVKFISSNENIAAVDEDGNIKGISSGEAIISVETVEKPTIEKKVKVKVINIETRSNGATYVNDILLVNKKYTLPATYNFGVDKTAKEKFEQMRKAALKDNISLKIVSSFRSYSSQAAIYNNNVKLHGAVIANRFSAKPGQSEHQTGLAFDINQANRSFVGTKEAIWLQKNCYKYGFIIRYPSGKESITGYVYEPWHVRYVGEQVSKEIYESGLCLEEYLCVN